MTRLLALAGVAAVLTVGALSVTPVAAATWQPYPQCMVDEGYGRIRPCSSLYKRQHPNWRAGPECMADDGYGRYRPCTSLFRQAPSGPTGQYNPSPYVPSAPKPGY